MNFNPFNKPPLNKIFKNANERPEAAPAASHESESNLLSKLALITSFLAVMGSAEAKSPALREFGSFEDLQAKSKTEFVKLQQKMHEMGTDTIRYEAGTKKMTIINHNGATTYIEAGGGNMFTIDDLNGDGLADKVKIEGHIDGSKTIQGDPEIAKRKGEITKVEHSFSQDIQNNSRINVGSTINLTRMEEVKVFLSTQDKFVQGVEGAISDIENGGGALAQK
jgi:hypothetical protein